jgi:hypothetical protein
MFFGRLGILVPHSQGENQMAHNNVGKLGKYKKVTRQESALSRLYRRLAWLEENGWKNDAGTERVRNEIEHVEANLRRK